MPSPRRPEPPPSTTPQSFPQTLPPEAAGQHSFILQSLYELRGSLGELSAKVDHLVKAVEGQGDRIDQLRHQVTFVKGAMWVMGALLGVVVLAVGWYFSGKLSVTINPAGPQAHLPAPAPSQGSPSSSTASAS